MQDVFDLREDQYEEEKQTLQVTTDRYAWTIRQPMESDSDQPIRPWFGKVVIQPNGLVYIHNFNRITKEIDDDFNATALVKEADLFEDYEASLKAYRGEIEQEIEILKQEILDREHDMYWTDQQIKQQREIKS
ncbi:hypothetical protein ACQ4M3_12865 [Leptolyngbya sp. AN03gr2]|uniref:hypothetical protein n=1 Tax=unclassified Leptolyngbya TaxID=2650499 RepID=UPI003D318999